MGEFFAGVAQNILSDWASALIAPLGLIIWQLAKTIWRRRSEFFTPAFWRGGYPTWKRIRLALIVLFLVFAYFCATLVFFAPLFLMGMATGFFAYEYQMLWVGSLFIAYPSACLTATIWFIIRRIFYAQDPYGESLLLLLRGSALLAAIASPGILLFLLPTSAFATALGEAMLYIFNCVFFAIFLPIFYLGYINIALDRNPFDWWGLFKGALSWLPNRDPGGAGATRRDEENDALAEPGAINSSN